MGLFRRVWRYVKAALTGRFNEMADPKIQLEQAIMEAQDQHRRLKEQAANVIANQKQTEMRLSRSMEELERLNASARQAITMASEAETQGDANRARELTQAAESFANRLIAAEHEVENLKQMQLQAVEAANQAKAAVNQNGVMLQQRLSERQKLMGQLDQAKMQEQVNSAMASLSETVGGDVPTLDEVRDKIEARYAKARGMAELNTGTVENRMFEVEQAAMNNEARNRLASMRAELGLGSGTDAPAVGQGQSRGQKSPAENEGGTPTP